MLGPIVFWWFIKRLVCDWYCPSVSSYGYQNLPIVPLSTARCGICPEASHLLLKSARPVRFICISVIILVIVTPHYIYPVEFCGASKHHRKSKYSDADISIVNPSLPKAWTFPKPPLKWLYFPASKLSIFLSKVFLGGHIHISSGIEFPLSA